MSDTPFAPGTKPAAHTRVTARESTLLAATVQFEGENLANPVRVRNISSGGMMIDSNVRRIPGLGLVAEIKNVGKVHGRIAWIDDQRMGISFDKEINPQLARLRVAPPPAPKAPRPLFPAA